MQMEEPVGGPKREPAKLKPTKKRPETRRPPKVLPEDVDLEQAAFGKRSEKWKPK